MVATTPTADESINVDAHDNTTSQRKLDGWSSTWFTQRQRQEHHNTNWSKVDVAHNEGGIPEG